MVYVYNVQYRYVYCFIIPRTRNLEICGVDSMNNLTKEQKFVIFWLYNTVAKIMPSNPIKGGGDDITVDGINVTETVRDLLKDRLFV